MLRRVHDDHPLGAFVAGDADGNVGREPAVGEEPPTESLGREEQRHTRARADGLGQVTRPQHHRLAMRQVGCDGAERDDKRVEIAARQQISPQERGVDQRVRLGLDHRRGLERETAIPLFPEDERLQYAERSRGQRLVGAEEGGERYHTRERIQLPAGIPTGVERTHHGAHAGANDQVGPDTEAVEHPQDADVGDPLGAAARQHERRAWRPTRLGAERRRRARGDRGRQREHQSNAAKHRTEDITTPCATPYTFVYLLGCASRSGAHEALEPYRRSRRDDVCDR